MTTFILLGDMLVMAFMIGLAAWLLDSGDSKALDETARIPLQDEDEDEDCHG